MKRNEQQSRIVMIDIEYTEYQIELTFRRLGDAMDIKQCDIRCVDYRRRQESHSWSSSRHSHVA